MWFRVIFGFIGALIFGVSALAVENSTIRTQISKGEYQAAYEAASQLETADGYALAAESLLSEIMLGQAEKNKKQAKRARKLAKAALEIDPMHPNARLQHAIADGFVTRETGDVSAWMKKLPQKTFSIVGALRQDFPDAPRGDALLGAWHLAIVRKVEQKNAEKWFDADIEQGRALFQKARLAEPNDIVIGVTYAFALIALSDEDLPDVSEARLILEAMMTVEASDYMAKVVQGYGQQALIRFDDRAATRDYVGQFLDGKQPT